MDMRETTRVEVVASDVDQFGYMPPRRMVQLLILAGMERNRTEGGGMPVLRAQFGAAWMFRRIRMEQFLPVKEGDVLQGYGSGRTMLENEMIYRGEFRRGGELVAFCDLVVMPVNLKERIKLKPAEVNVIYHTEPMNDVPEFPRLPICPDISFNWEKEITIDDCDENANHYASHNYADLVCTETGYWDGEYHMMKLLQLDYVKECRTGDRIKIGVKRQGEGFVVQGIHENGRPCVNSYCEYA